MTKKYYEDMKKFFQSIGIDTDSESVSKSAKDCPNFTATLSSDIQQTINVSRTKVK